MDWKNITVLFVAALGWIVCGTGCSERKGPFEDAGREIDDVIDDAQDKEKSTADKVGESIRDLGDRIEDSD